MMQLSRSFYVLVGTLVLCSAIACQNINAEFNRGSDEHKFNKRDTHVHHHYHNDAPAAPPAVAQAPARGGGMFGGGMMQNVATGTLMAGGAAFAGTAGHIAAENMFGGDKKDDKEDSSDHHHHDSEKTDTQQSQPVAQSQPAVQSQPQTVQQPLTVPQYQPAVQAQPAAQLPPYWSRMPPMQPQAGAEYQHVPPVPLAYLYPADTSLYAPAGSTTGFSISPNAMRFPFNSAGQSIYPASPQVYPTQDESAGISTLPLTNNAVAGTTSGTGTGTQ